MVEMFSGIIERQGEITGVHRTDAGRRLTIRAAGYWDELRPGASVAVDGVCLTLVERSGETGAFDVVGETLARSTLGRATAGGRVNLERSLRVGDRIDGHFVQGHVEGVGAIVRVDRSPGEQKWWIDAPRELMPCLMPKGSVSVDGISLTIVDVEPTRFSVVLIPTTLEMTTLGGKRAGDGVNLETDFLVRAALRNLPR